MAIQLMEFSGKIGTVVFYKWKGKQVARSLPKKAKRTKAMKARSSNFGVASSSAKKLRGMMKNFLPFPQDRDMQNGLTGAINKWIGRRIIADIIPETNIIYLDDFQLNSKCDLRQRWKVRLEVLNPSNGLLQLKVPAFIPMEAIIAPEDTVSVTLQICVAAVKLKKDSSETSFSASLEIPYDDTETGPHLIDLPINMERGTFIITACALHYNVKWPGSVATIIYKKPDYMPAGVVEARYC